MGLPASAFQLTTVILAALFTSYIRKSRLVAMVCIYLMAIAGILMVKLLPDGKKLSRLAGFWLVTAVAPAFPLMMSLFASNTAGFTKKSTTVAMIFVGYCVGNLIGPQFFKSSEAPNYHVSGGSNVYAAWLIYKTAYTTILVCFAITIAMAVFFWAYLGYINRKRDQEQGTHIDPEEIRAVDLEADTGLEEVDETDRQNKSFRYIL
ncbi:hypothetical protein AWENTII_003115 [Aspergillus wentii]